MATDIRVPDLGDFKEVEVIDVLVKPGDRIEVDTPLVTLETEKAAMDVPSTASGVVRAVTVKKGDRVSKGTAILSLEEGATAQAKPGPAAEAPAKPDKSKPDKSKPDESALDKSMPAAPPPGAPAQTQPQAEARTVPSTQPRASGPAAPGIDEAAFAKAHASPSVRKFAREMGVDLGRVNGTGIKGRITADDVKTWVKQALAAPGERAAGGGGALPKIPEIDFSKFGAIEVQPLGRIQKISGPRLHASWLNIPHVWQHDEADITELERTREALKGKAAERGIKLTPLAFVVRACVKALQQFPAANSSLDTAGQSLILKKYIHMGFAADTPNGLMVPVIRDADRKDVYEIARELAELSAKARDGKLSAAEMQGASFTISSLGGIGGTGFTPIINAPEVGILGVARSAMRPVYQQQKGQDGQFVPRLILPFTFAYDHRVIDGAAGVRFTTFLAQMLANPSALLEAVP